MPSVGLGSRLITVSGPNLWAIVRVWLEVGKDEAGKPVVTAHYWPWAVFGEWPGSGDDGGGEPVDEALMEPGREAA